MVPRKLLPLLLVLSSPLLLAAGQCSTKVAGGGSLASAGKSGTIALNANSCGDAVKGQFQYVDQNAGVKMHGDVVDAKSCVATPGSDNTAVCECVALTPGFGLGAADVQVEARYRSTDPAVAGEGRVIACVSDNGEGRKAAVPDTAAIHVIDGPYAGYSNIGVLKGNFQQQKCPGKTTGP